MAISASKATLMEAVNTRAEKGTRVERVPSILYRAKYLHIWCFRSRLWCNAYYGSNQSSW